ncbi:uncharacterized protein LOC135114712 isoform X2 [Scylla paramamosain]|uniref:uncharacterized protein LOC135114712 isoform X2 n=1 Tax=Scylla paramamosain TaxID=85552 RepID=UPI003083CFD5
MRDSTPPCGTMSGRQVGVSLLRWRHARWCSCCLCLLPFQPTFVSASRVSGVEPTRFCDTAAASAPSSYHFSSLPACTSSMLMNFPGIKMRKQREETRHSCKEPQRQAFSERVSELLFYKSCSPRVPVALSVTIIPSSSVLAAPTWKPAPPPPTHVVVIVQFLYSEPNHDKDTTLNGYKGNKKKERSNIAFTLTNSWWP